MTTNIMVNILYTPFIKLEGAIHLVDGPLFLILKPLSRFFFGLVQEVVD